MTGDLWLALVFVLALYIGAIGIVLFAVGLLRWYHGR